MPALIIAAVLIGVFVGWSARLHTVQDKYLAGMAARYRAQEAWLEARTAEMMAELDRDVTTVKRQLKKPGKPAQNGRKRQ